MDNASNRGTSFPQQQPRADAGGSVLEAARDKAKDVASGVAHVAGQVKDKAQQAWEGTKEVAGQAWEGTKHAAAATASAVEEGWDGFNGMIRRYPVPSVLIALGAGFLLGQCLSWSRRS